MRKVEIKKEKLELKEEDSHHLKFRLLNAPSRDFNTSLRVCMMHSLWQSRGCVELYKWPTSLMLHLEFSGVFEGLVIRLVTMGKRV